MLIIITLLFIIIIKHIHNKMITEVAMQHRAGEEQNIPLRNERYSCINGIWFFKTRGGKQKGPFVNKQEMEAELLFFIREQKMSGQSRQQPA